MSSIDWERVARAHLNATRLLVLDGIASAGQPVSAAVLSRALGRPTNEVAYHVSALAQKGLIELHSSRQGRGARETFYVLT